MLNVYENIEFPLLLGKDRGKAEKRREWIDYLIEEVGLAKPGQAQGRTSSRAGSASAWP